MRFWVKILSKSAETLGRKGFYILWKKAGGKNTREEEVLPPWTHLFWLGGPCGGPLFFSAWPAALYLTPVTARPPAGRAGRGGCCSRKGTHLPPKPSPRVNSE